MSLCVAWLITWGSLQAFILTTTSQQQRVFSVKVVNGLFVGGGILLFGIVIAAGIINTLAGDTVWRRYLLLKDELVFYESQWNSTQTAADQYPAFLAITPAISGLTDSLEYSRTTSIVAFSVLMVVPFLIAAVNVGAILLAKLVRKQLVFHIAQATTTVGQSVSGANSATSGVGVGSLQPAVPTVIQFTNSFQSANGEQSSMPAQSGTTTQVPGSRFGSVDSTGGGEKPLRTSQKHMSRAALKSLVTRRGSDADRARNIQALQKADADLTILAVSVMVLLLGVSGLCAFLFIEYFKGKLSNGPWWINEVCLFGVYCELRPSHSCSRRLS